MRKVATFLLYGNPRAGELGGWWGLDFDTDTPPAESPRTLGECGGRKRGRRNLFIYFLSSLFLSSGSTTMVAIQLANGGQVLLPITAGEKLVCEVVATVARSPLTREGL